MPEYTKSLRLSVRFTAPEKVEAVLWESVDGGEDEDGWKEIQIFPGIQNVYIEGDNIISMATSDGTVLATNG